MTAIFPLVVGARGNIPKEPAPEEILSTLHGEAESVGDADADVRMPFAKPSWARLHVRTRTRPGKRRREDPP